MRYPWSESDFGFSSSDSMLTKVYDLCANTLRVTSLDTTTDSNPRERLPCEKQYAEVVPWTKQEEVGLP